MRDLQYVNIQYCVMRITMLLYSTNPAYTMRIIVLLSSPSCSLSSSTVQYSIGPSRTVLLSVLYHSSTTLFLVHVHAQARNIITTSQEDQKYYTT